MKIQYWQTVLHGEVDAHGVLFTDNNGKSASLAFDHRPSIENFNDYLQHVEFGTYTACPIMTDALQADLNATDRETATILRDALNDMLGEG